MPPLQSLNMKHYMIANLYAQGKSASIISKRLKVSLATIQNCFDTPEFNIVLERLEDEYSRKIADQVVLPLAEMQNKINEEALGALSRIVDISQSEKANTAVLNANLALLDRASNVPKASKNDSSEAPQEIFNVSMIQLVLETAAQVGDRTVLSAAHRALKRIPEETPVQEVVIDAESSPTTLPPPRSSSSLHMKSLDDLLSETCDPDEELE